MVKSTQNKNIQDQLMSYLRALNMWLVPICKPQQASVASRRFPRETSHSVVLSRRIFSSSGLPSQKGTIFQSALQLTSNPTLCSSWVLQTASGAWEVSPKLSRPPSLIHRERTMTIHRSDASMLHPDEDSLKTPRRHRMPLESSMQNPIAASIARKGPAKVTCACDGEAVVRGCLGLN